MYEAMRGCEAELPCGFGPDRAEHARTGGRGRLVSEQHRLPDTGRAADHECAASRCGFERAALSARLSLASFGEALLSRRRPLLRLLLALRPRVGGASVPAVEGGVVSG